jgi:hypothetical protein
LTRAAHLREGAPSAMQQLVDFLTRWLTAFFDVLASAFGSAVSIFNWPAEVTGIPPELLGAATLCLLLLALWRAMGGYWNA